MSTVHEGKAPRTLAAALHKAINDSNEQSTGRAPLRHKRVKNLLKRKEKGWLTDVEAVELKQLLHIEKHGRDNRGVANWCRKHVLDNWVTSYDLFSKQNHNFDKEAISSALTAMGHRGEIEVRQAKRGQHGCKCEYRRLQEERKTGFTEAQTKPSAPPPMPAPATDTEALKARADALEDALLTLAAEAEAISKELADYDARVRAEYEQWIAGRPGNVR